MLYLTIPKTENYDEKTETFVDVKEQVLQLEHSLLSISKWESKWHIPFLADVPRTPEQTVDYIKCMTINRDVDPLVYKAITKVQSKQITAYIEDPMTATTFPNLPGSSGRSNRDIITSEVIYYWMVAQQIPFECEKWHLNRLLTLIEVCNRKNAPQKKVGKKENLNNIMAINEARKRQFNTTG